LSEVKQRERHRGSFNFINFAVIMNRILLALAAVVAAFSSALAETAPADSLVIDKRTMTLTVWRGGEAVACYGVATGRHPGNKVAEGDMRTPEGHFFISEIVDATEWTHDFGDGLGEVNGAYGPWFMRLDTPGHTGIGIHGTHQPQSIGTRASEGCIRLRNEDLAALYAMVRPLTPVSIYPGTPDREVNAIIEEIRQSLTSGS